MFQSKTIISGSRPTSTPFFLDRENEKREVINSLNSTFMKVTNIVGRAGMG